MKANELRIGNWVSNGDRYYKITAAAILHLTQGDLDCYPIPINAEWLLKFGFEKALNGWWCPDEVVSYKEGYAGFGTNTYTQIKHVHQLQNLYFALTGKELEIKQP